MASSPAASTPSWKYDVFLSFRGEDTRRNFTDHLHAALKRFGIITFIDEQIMRGEQISPALLQEIEDSRFSIIIFSQNYASSSWCLDELSKILECVHNGKHTAFPVFYEVDPSHVRYQRGSYAEAFKKHEAAYKDNIERVVKWRDGLTEASRYSGWHITRDRYQSEVIDNIVDKIFNEVPRNASPSNLEHMVGMDSRMKDMLSLLCLDSPEVRMVGIWGMAGIGKTTLAEAIYQRIHTQFEGCCFLSNVREKSNRMMNLQLELLSKILRKKKLDDRISNSRVDYIEKVLRSKKVLIVLDDVDHIKQLEELARRHDWFGPKSRIIITTRDKRLLIEKNVDAIYEAKELLKHEALKLFCKYAFKDKPPEDFKELCNCFLDYTKGHPLVIKILSSFLYKRSKQGWVDELERLKKFPNSDVQDVMRISFDALEDTVKNIFLDIACFFKGKDKDNVSEIMESCDLYPHIGIDILVERALITISLNNKLCMHDLIQEMGWEIVRQQSIKDPGQHSRLWLNEDVELVLKTNTGTKEIQGIVLDLSASEGLDFSGDAFTKMTKLRVLRLHIAPTIGNRQCFSTEELLTRNKLHLTGHLKFLSDNLRYLCWHNYPLKSIPTSFYPRKLFELDMSFSRLKQLWEGYKSFPRLKYMDLSHSQDLIKIPDLSGAPRLKKINLQGCTSLVEIHPSIGTLVKLSLLKLEGCSKLEKLPESIANLTSLHTLNLYGCSELKKLPDDMGISLQTLNLCGCSKLEKFPDSMGSLQCLVSLIADGSGIQELPSSINLLTKLQEISLVGCKGGGKSILRNLVSSLRSSTARQGLRLPSSLHLVSLRKLKLSDCNLWEGALPTDLSSLYSLEYLDLSRNSFISLPSLSPLAKLRLLTLESCTSLQSLTELPSSIRTVKAQNCQSLKTFSHLANSYAMWESGELQFDFSNCRQLLENEHDDSLEAILRGIRIRSLSKPCRSRNYNAVVAGSSIPEWFIHQIAGNSITIKLPPEFKDNRSTGLAFCAVFADNHKDSSQLGRCEYYTWNEFEGFSQYDVVVSAPMHCSEYDHIWFGYASLPHISDHEESDYYSQPMEGTLIHSSGDSGYYCGGKGINHLKVSFVGDDRVAPVVKRCGIRLLQEPDCRKPMMNGEIIEYDTVPAISCLPEVVFFGGHYWKEDLFVGNTSARLGLRVEVEGYHKNVVREGKRSAQAPNPVPAALMERKLDSTSIHVKPSSEDVQDILKQHPSFLLTEACIVQGELVRRLEAAEQLRLFVTNFMEENAGLRSEPDSAISRDRTCLQEEIDHLARDLATSIQKEAYERVNQLTQDNEALQAQVDQLLAERNDAGVSGERDQDGVGCCLCQ